jgi:N-dimethylarginine dimethylaminohydrolase
VLSRDTVAQYPSTLEAELTISRIGPQIFRESEVRHYPTAFKLIAGSYALAALSSLALRFYLMWANRKWDKAEDSSVDSVKDLSAEALPEDPIAVLSLPNAPQVDAKGFRYRL